MASFQDTLPAAAVQGFQDAAAYDQHRPTYPASAVEVFLKKLKVAGMSDVNIVEVAAGTGKFTELLASRPEGFLVKAGMRGKLAEKDLRAVEVLAGTADKMPIPEGWGDACIAAQAFHWFSTPESLKEIRRVLRPGAVFGATWNVEDYNKPADWPASTRWEQKLNDYVWSLEDGSTRFRHMKWREIFEKQPPGNPIQVIRDTMTDRLPRFTLPIGEYSEKWTVWLSEEALWSRFGTLSQIAVMKGQEKEEAVAVFKAALESDDVERNEKGEIALHGSTYCAWTDAL